MEAQRRSRAAPTLPAGNEPRLDERDRRAPVVSLKLPREPGIDETLKEADRLLFGEGSVLVVDDRADERKIAHGIET